MKKTYFYLMAFMACFLTSCAPKEEVKLYEHITTANDNVYYYMKGLDKPFNILFVSDTHFTIEDERGRDFYKYSKRMGGKAVEPENYGKTNGREKYLLASLEKAKKNQSELVILCGDIINFPSLASVEYIKNVMDESGLNWVYTAGNHDWHYEGEPGINLDHRKKWTESNMKPLYQGQNPMYHSQILHNINFITMDNSLFEITDEQIEFFKGELKKGLPIILSVHVPLYLQGHDINYSWGNPLLNKEADYLYKMEGREPWPEEGLSENSFKFRDLVLNSPEVIGIFAGHIHKAAIDMVNNKLQYVQAANFMDKDILIHFIPAE